nr:MAG TPA: hypothetical protein [Caudoviricetes sp.]
MIFHFNHHAFWSQTNFIHLIIAKMNCIHHQRIIAPPPASN